MKSYKDNVFPYECECNTPKPRHSLDIDAKTYMSIQGRYKPGDVLIRADTCPQELHFPETVIETGPGYQVIWTKYLSQHYHPHIDVDRQVVVIENFHGDIIMERPLPVHMENPHLPSDLTELDPANLKVWQEVYQLAEMAQLGEQTYLDRWVYNKK